MAIDRYQQNSFKAGEVGERLSALRGSDLYKNSVKKLENFIITPIGNLKVSKKYKEEARAEIVGDVIKVIATKYNYDIVVTTSEIVLYERDTWTHLKTHAKVTSKTDNVFFIQHSLFVGQDIFDIDPTTHDITTNSKFHEGIVLPLKNKSNVTVDIYHVRKMFETIPGVTAGDALRTMNYNVPVKIGTVQNPDIEIKSGSLYINDGKDKIDKIYPNYTAGFTRIVSDVLTGFECTTGDTADLKTHETFKMQFNPIPSTSVLKGLTFSTSDTDLVEVHPDGSVKGLKAGTAHIVVRAGGFSKTITITVADAGTTTTEVAPTNPTSPNDQEYVAGQFFMVVHPYLESKDGHLVIGNENITLSGEHTDHFSLKYYTGTSTPTGDHKGKLEYGEVIKIFDNYKTMTEFQSRLYVHADDRIYASKVADYNNFRNGTLDDEGFYFTPSLINNEEPNILKLLVGKGLYILTDLGVFVLGYNKIVTPSSISIMTATDEPASTDAVVLDRDLYFIQHGKYEDTLYCLQDTSSKELQVDFKAFKVDKYSFSQDYKDLGIISIFGEKYMFANSKTSNTSKIYLFRSFNLGNFVRTTIYVDDDKTKVVPELVGFKEGFVTKGVSYKMLNDNKKEAFCEINIPSLQTPKGGFYMNDIPSRTNRIVLKVLEEVKSDIRAIEDVYFGNNDRDIRLNQLGLDENLHNVYKVETGIPMNNGLHFKIVSKENDHVLEVQAYEIFMNVNGD